MREPALPKVLEPLQEITKAVVGMHVLLTHPPFASYIPRRLLLRASPVKPLSAALMC
jgi:hypothetical protein